MVISISNMVIKVVMTLAGGYGCRRLERKSQSERLGLQKTLTCEEGRLPCECQDVHGRRDSPDMNGNNSVSIRLSVSQVREQKRRTVDCQHGVCSEAEEPNPSLRAASVGFDRCPFRTRRGYL